MPWIVTDLPKPSGSALPAHAHAHSSIQERPKILGNRKTKTDQARPGLVLVYSLGDEMYRQASVSAMAVPLSGRLSHDTSSAKFWRGLFGLLRRSTTPRGSLIIQGQKHLQGNRLRNMRKEANKAMRDLSMCAIAIANRSDFKSQIPKSLKS